MRYYILITLLTLCSNGCTLFHDAPTQAEILESRKTYVQIRYFQPVTMRSPKDRAKTFYFCGGAPCDRAITVDLPLR